MVAAFLFALFLGTIPAHIPDKLKVPAGQVLVLEAHGTGRQIYACQSENGQFAWKLKAPDAVLLDRNGRQVGRHFAGPTWQASDGSRVTGKTTASVPSPQAGAIPWLLLEAKSNEGAGIFSRVKSIQRLNTKGGKAPDGGCEAGHEKAETAVTYEADYYFYGGR